MSPISNPDPCPHIREDDDFIFCDRYDIRPDACIKHTFPGARFCPIGLDVLNLEYPRDTEKIRIRLDMGYGKIHNTDILGNELNELYNRRNK